MKKKYIASIIGTGRIGYSLQKDKKREQPASHSAALKKNNNIKITAGCDIDKNKLILWKKDYPNAQIFTDHKLLLKNIKSDIVVITVDENAHLRISLDVIKSRPLLIILEKPVAPTVREALKIKKLADKYSVPICINHERRFSEDYLQLKEILNQKLFGKIHTVHASLWSNLNVWKKGCKNPGNYSLIHDGTHLIDIVNFLFEESLNKPNIDKIIKKKKYIESLFVHYKLSKNKIIFIEINGQKKYFGFEIEIRGENGRCIIGNGYFDVYFSKLSPYYTNFRSLVKEKKYKRPNKTCYFSNMINNCVKYLDGKSELISPVSEGIKVLKNLYKIINIIDK